MFGAVWPTVHAVIVSVLRFCWQLRSPADGACGLAARVAKLDQVYSPPEETRQRLLEIRKPGVASHRSHWLAKALTSSIFPVYWYNGIKSCCSGPREPRSRDPSSYIQDAGRAGSARLAGRQGKPAAGVAAHHPLLSPGSPRDLPSHHFPARWPNDHLFGQFPSHGSAHGISDGKLLR